MPTETTAYRYTLVRRWDDSRPLIGWVCLNPSTATADEDDATTRKLRGFSERWGFGRYMLVNLFPMRATNPEELIAATVRERLSRRPDSAVELIVASLLDCDELVLAWGARGDHAALSSQRDTALQYLQLHGGAKPITCLGLTKSGDPKHPLYLSYATQRRPFVFNAVARKMGAGR